MRFIFMMMAVIVSAGILNARAPAAIADGPAPTEPMEQPGIPCGKPSAAWNTLTPPELYGGMVSCIGNQDYESAVYFFAVGGTYIYFDSLRVTDETARSAQTALLQKAVADLDRIKRDTLMDAIQRFLGNAEELPIVCAEVARIGAPQYYPRYIIRQDTIADPGKSSEGELVKEFDPAAGWKEAMNGYLHCPSFGK